MGASFIDAKKMRKSMVICADLKKQVTDREAVRYKSTLRKKRKRDFLAPLMGAFDLRKKVRFKIL